MLIVAALSTTALAAQAQRVAHSRTAVHEIRLPAATSPAFEAQAAEAKPTGILVLGGVIGAASVGAIVWVATNECVEFDCLTPIGLAIVLEGFAVPMGVHVANDGRGPLGLLGSYFVEILGLFALSTADQARSDIAMASLGALTVGAQIALAIDGKRRAARKLRDK